MSVVVNDLDIGDVVGNTRMLLGRVKRRKKKNGGEFLEIYFSDKTGTIEGRKWENTDLNHVQEGEVVRVNGKVVPYKGSSQLKVYSISEVDQEKVDYTQYVEKINGDPKLFYQTLKQFGSNIKSSAVSKFYKYCLNKHEKKFIKWPAASSNHHAKVGGLVKHICSMMCLAQKTTNHYKQLYDDYEGFDRDVVDMGILLHDFFKIETIESPITRSKSDKAKKIGHIGLALEHLAKYKGELDGKYEAIQHVVASHHGKKEWGSPVEPQTPEAKLVHRLDMMDSRMDKVFNK